MHIFLFKYNLNFQEYFIALQEPFQDGNYFKGLFSKDNSQKHFPQLLLADQETRSLTGLRSERQVSLKNRTIASTESQGDARIYEGL